MKTLLVAYDNGSYIHDFPHSIAYIAAAIREQGQLVRIYNQDINHYPDEHLTEYLDNNKFDAIGIGVIAGYYQYRKVISICKAINKSKQRPVVILGGHGPTPDPDFFFKKTGADFIVMGEGEATIIDLLETIRLEGDFHTVKGISFQQDGETIINERRQRIENIDNILMPAYDLFPMEHYRLIRYPHAEKTEFCMSMLSGRGCIFNCTFCLTENTKIKTPSGEKKISDLTENDTVLALDEKTKDIKETKINKTFQRKDNYYKITLEDGTELEISEEHPVYTQRGWIEVKDLKKDDKVLKT